MDYKKALQIAKEIKSELNDCRMWEVEDDLDSEVVGAIADIIVKETK